MAKTVSPVRVADGGDGAAAGPRESDSFTGNTVVAHFVEGWDGREGGREGGLQSDTISQLMPCHYLDPVESMTAVLAGNRFFRYSPSRRSLQRGHLEFCRVTCTACAATSPVDPFF